MDNASFRVGQELQPGTRRRRAATAEGLSSAEACGAGAPWDERAEAILSAPIRYVDHPSFHDESQLAGLLAAVTSPGRDGESSEATVPRGLPAFLESLYRVPLLSKEQEVRLFQRMNAYKAMAERVRVAAASEGNTPESRASAVARIEELLARASALRAEILQANQRLVVSIAKRFAGKTGDLFEMISDANLPLMEAVDRFDFSRGYRFSTYATWAIRNGLIRTVAVERRRRERYQHGMEELFEAVPDHRSSGEEAGALQKNPIALIRALLDLLSDRERAVLEGRYGLDGTRQKSLRQIGSQIGVSKERARQIEIAAREKLRKFSGRMALSPIPA